MRARETATRPDRERLAVIDNIERALEECDPARKVEVSDPVYTKKEADRKILRFDCLKKNPLNKLKAEIARKFAERQTEKINEYTKIIGIENALSVGGGAVITANHFNPMDNTVIRLMAMRLGKGKNLHVLVQEGNMFMKGVFGFLMRNCYTLPVSKNHVYTAKNLNPAVKTLLERGAFILVYPESEMWYNYKKPRPLAIGAYHYASLVGVPIIPTFIGMQETESFDGLGFKNLKHTLIISPPIYPDLNLAKRERAAKMREEDMKSKIKSYETFYQTKLDPNFVRERDIGGYFEF